MCRSCTRRPPLQLPFTLSFLRSYVSCTCMCACTSYVRLLENQGPDPLQPPSSRMGSVTHWYTLGFALCALSAVPPFSKYKMLPVFSSPNEFPATSATVVGHLLPCQGCVCPDGRAARYPFPFSVSRYPSNFCPLRCMQQYSGIPRISAVQFYFCCPAPAVFVTYSTT